MRLVKSVIGCKPGVTRQHVSLAAAYSEIRGINHWTGNEAFWNVAHSKMDGSSITYTENDGGGSSTVAIGNDTLSVFEAILQQPN
ncbi:hypothetical protein PTKIN_Ptkin11bG0057100 [Pterospermum kingtungense]